MQEARDAVYRREELIYRNALAGPEDVARFVMEGEGAVSFPRGRLRMESRLEESEGQKANIVFWCPEEFPDNIEISWDFRPLREPGLSMLFFAARGAAGEDLFSPSLAPRNGEYRKYHSGDINALHVSYFRRKAPKERALQVCNLRKSRGFHLVAQGADPIPSVADASIPYRIRVAKLGPYVEFGINGLTLFTWTDDGVTRGDVLGGGKIGFRQMAPLLAEYSELTVYRIARNEPSHGHG